MSKYSFLGIDPGTSETGYCLIDENYKIYQAAKVQNAQFILDLKSWIRVDFSIKHIVIEDIQSFGAVSGRSIYQTNKMIGRIQQVADDNDVCWTEYPRQEYSTFICGGKANDSMLRQALLLRFGGDRKDEPLEKLRGNSDKRSAFAVAIYHLDMMKLKERANER